MNGYPEGMADPQQSVSRQTTSFAVASMVLGIISFIPFLGWVTSILAIIFGSLRLRHGSAGRGMAIAGFTLGLICLVGWIVWLVLAIALTASSPSGS